MNNPKLSKDELGSKIESSNIIEERCPHTGVIINRYSKGRRLGKVLIYLIKGGFAVCH